MDRRDFLKNAIATGAAAVGCGAWVGVGPPAVGHAVQPIRPPGAL
ncbi:MAG TPA: twin-arginine translocation signal domain-containing protein, partial [Planctomycetaceae bacterium]|nr:twin-arginine translocation signal domain-containing protein [Planctomycetaceae bacterium]